MCTLRSETIFANWKSCENDDKCLFFTLKAIFVLKIFNFFIVDFFFIRKNDLVKKICLISEFKTSQPGKKQLQYTCIAQYLKKQKQSNNEIWNLVS